MKAKLLQALRWLNPHRPNRAPSYGKMLLFWNPVFSVIFTAAMAYGTFWLSVFYAFVISEVVTLTNWAVTGVFGWAERVYFRRRALVPPPARRQRILVVVLASMVVGLELGFRLVGAIAWQWQLPWTQPSLGNYGSGLLFGALFLALYLAIDLWWNARRALEELQSSHLQAKIAALTAQMNPHLLFNSLNTIASMIPSDPRAAEETTVRLSELYRGVLDASRHATHSLAREIEICRAYLEIESARFGERLRAEFALDPELRPESIEIPTLLLQPLVENAVKHGIAPRALGGRIAIGARREGARLVLSVEDDGPGFGRSRSKPGSGTGIANCRSRLSLRYGADGVFEILPRDGGGTRIELRLPEGRA